MDDGVLEVGLLARQIDPDRAGEHQTADHLGMIDRHLDGVGGGQAGGDDHRPAAHHVVEEVEQELDVELDVERGRRALGAAPAGKIGGEDLEALGQPLRGLAPLERVVAWSEGMQQDERVAGSEALEDDVGEIPGIAVAAAPDGRLDAPRLARDRGIDDRGQADRRAAQEQAAQDPLTPLSTLLFFGSPGCHGRLRIPCRPASAAASPRR